MDICVNFLSGFLGALRPFQQRTESGSEKILPRSCVDKDLAERSGELSGAICLKALVLLGSDPVTLELFRNFFGAVRAIFWLCGSFLGC